MESTLVIDSINVKKFSLDNVVDIEIDDGRLSISISLPLDMYEMRYFKTTEKKRLLLHQDNVLKTSVHIAELLATMFTQLAATLLYQ